MSKPRVLVSGLFGFTSAGYAPRLFSSIVVETTPTETET